jgi:hypothetical protein
MPKPTKPERRQVMFVFTEQDAINFAALRAHFPTEFTKPSGGINSTLVFRKALQLAVDSLPKKKARK